MEEIKDIISELSDCEKIALFEIIRDDLKLRSRAEMACVHGKNYGGVAFFKGKLNTSVGKTMYFVDK